MWKLKNFLAIDDIPYDEWRDKLIKERFVSEYFAAGYNTGATTQYACITPLFLLIVQQRYLLNLYDIQIIMKRY